MALLTVNERKAIFKQLGFGEYNEKSIKAFQKKYMLRKSDYDGVYGPNTDNTLRTVFYTLKYTKNFKPEEFRCECNGKYCCGYPSYMKPAELIHIQAIRDHWKKPITVTCGLRCKTWNSKLGGSIQNSLHMKGQAIDFYQQGVTDTLKNRKASIKWIAKQKNHHYTYGNGIYRLTTNKTYSGSVSAPYMGNALHTDTNDNVKPVHPEWKEPAKPTPAPQPKPEPAPVVPKKTVDEIAKEIVDGKGNWGNGDERKKKLKEAGYDYDAVQKKVNDILASQTTWVDKANAWAKKIAADNSYHYVKWTSKDAKTHECPICHNHPKGKYHGWNCIGFAFAVWHHGGGLPNRCYNGTISNDIWNKMYNGSAAEALALAKKHTKLNDIEVIVNKNGIPKSQWKAGDILAKFAKKDGKIKYTHTFYYMGDGKIAESTGMSGKIPNDKQIRIKDYKNCSARIIVRYKGK